jgi:hypothetical protein
MYTAPLRRQIPWPLPRHLLQMLRRQGKGWQLTIASGAHVRALPIVSRSHITLHTVQPGAIPIPAPPATCFPATKVCLRKHNLHLYTPLVQIAGAIGLKQLCASTLTICCLHPAHHHHWNRDHRHRLDHLHPRHHTVSFPLLSSHATVQDNSHPVPFIVSPLAVCQRLCPPLLRSTCWATMA